MNYDRQWFDSLAKPDFQPPNWVFTPVWIVLYFLMFVSFFFIIKDFFHIKNIIAAILFFGQLYVNIIWPKAFFKEHNLRKAFLLSALLNFLVFLTNIAFFKVSITAGILFLPYLFWCCFATVLSFEILERNEW